ncbi:MAG: protein kinase [Pirellulaceae bacterium]
MPGCNLRQYLAKSDDDAPHKPDTTATTNPYINDRQLSIRETLSVLLQVLAALNKSAASGIVHRDIKPENIMLTQDGDVKVADFGLAASAARRRSAANACRHDVGDADVHEPRADSRETSIFAATCIRLE